jgi:hypothetical protein
MIETRRFPVPEVEPGPIFELRPPSTQAGGPMNLNCICPGNHVPFYCPKHGCVENPNWPLLKPALAASLTVIEETTGSIGETPPGEACSP